MSEVNMEERISNLLLLLYTIQRTNQLNKMDDTRKLQKLVKHGLPFNRLAIFGARRTMVHASGMRGNRATTSPVVPSTR